jgi:hypothetical protein
MTYDPPKRKGLFSKLGDKMLEPYRPGGAAHWLTPEFHEGNPVGQFMAYANPLMGFQDAGRVMTGEGGNPEALNVVMSATPLGRVPGYLLGGTFKYASRLARAIDEAPKMARGGKRAVDKWIQQFAKAPQGPAHAEIEALRTLARQRGVEGTDMPVEKLRELVEESDPSRHLMGGRIPRLSDRDAPLYGLKDSRLDMQNLGHPGEQGMNTEVLMVNRQGSPDGGPLVPSHHWTTAEHGGTRMEMTGLPENYSKNVVGWTKNTPVNFDEYPVHGTPHATGLISKEIQSEAPGLLREHGPRRLVPITPDYIAQHRARYERLLPINRARSARGQTLMDRAQSHRREQANNLVEQIAKAGQLSQQETLDVRRVLQDIVHYGDPGWVDSQTFEDAVKEAVAHQAEGSPRRRALELIRRNFSEDELFDRWRTINRETKRMERRATDYNWDGRTHRLQRAQEEAFRESSLMPGTSKIEPHPYAWFENPSHDTPRNWQTPALSQTVAYSLFDDFDAVGAPTARNRVANAHLEETPAKIIYDQSAPKVFDDIFSWLGVAPKKTAVNMNQGGAGYVDLEDALNLWMMSDPLRGQALKAAETHGFPAFAPGRGR